MRNVSEKGGPDTQRHSLSRHSTAPVVDCPALDELSRASRDATVSTSGALSAAESACAWSSCTSATAALSSSAPFMVAQPPLHAAQHASCMKHTTHCSCANSSGKWRCRGCGVRSALRGNDGATMPWERSDAISSVAVLRLACGLPSMACFDQRGAVMWCEQWRLLHAVEASACRRGRSGDGASHPACITGCDQCALVLSP